MVVYKEQKYFTSIPERHRQQWKLHKDVSKIASCLNEERKELLSNLCLFIYTHTEGITAIRCLPALIAFVQNGLSFNQCIDGLVFVINRGDMFGGEEKATKLYLEIIKDEFE